MLASAEPDRKIKELLDLQPQIINLNNIIILFQKYSDCQNLEWIIGLLSNQYINPDLSIKSILERIIEEVSPLGERFSKIKDMSAYSLDIEKLRYYISSFPRPDNYQNLEFWSEICKIHNKNLVLNIAGDLFGRGHDFLFKSEMAKKIINSLQSLPNEDSQSAHKFKIFFYTQLIEHNQDMIPIITREINTKDAWKHSGPLIETLLECSNLKESLEDFEVEDSRYEEFIRIFNEGNSYLVILTSVIEPLAYQDTLCVMLADKVKVLNFNVNRKRLAQNCRTYMSVLEGFVGSSDKLKVIVASGRVRNYLNQFVVALNPNRDNLTVSEESIIEDIGKILSEQKSLNYELNSLKVLRGLTKVSTLKLNELCEKTKYKWRINYKDIGVQSSFEVFPYLDDVSLDYRRFVIKIDALIENIKEFDEMLDKQQGVNEIELFALGLAFLNSVYLMYTRPSFDKKPYVSWLEDRAARIEQKFGKTFAALLRCFVCNFPQGSVCCLSGSSSSYEFQLAMVAAYTALVAVSYASIPNQFSMQFFDTHGKVHPSFQNHSLQAYFIGAEPRKIHDYLKYTLRNYDIIKNTTYNQYHHMYSRGGSHVCSNNCDYLYIINDCGGAMVESDCPFCGSRIGGSKHQIIKRPGHRNLDDKEALSFLGEKINFYFVNEPKGFTHFEKNVPLVAPRKFEHQIYFILLNLFTNSVFDFLSASDLVEDDRLRVVYNSGNLSAKELIPRILKNDFGELVDKLGGEDLIYRILVCVGELRKTMIESESDVMSREKRDQFEIRFESRLENKMGYDIIDLCNQYKKLLATQTEPSILINYIEELELPQEPEYNLTQLFRYTTIPTWQTLRDAFNLSSTKKDYPCLDYYINNFEELSNLEHFYNLVDFAREMINECSFMISRAESLNITINEFLKTRSSMKPKFEDFRKSWNKLRIVLRFDCKVFDKFEVTYDTTISYFLVDTDINSPGIRLAAALRNLSEIQNGIINLISNPLSENQSRFPILSLSKDDIFYINNDNLSSIIQSGSNNCVEYSKGQEIFYDWSRISFSIQQNLEKSKFLNCENIQTVQFQFELLNARSRYAGAINEIREKIFQTELSPEETQEIDRKMRAKAQYFNTHITQVWLQGYNWLEKVLLQVRHVRTFNTESIGKCVEVETRILNDFQVYEIFGGFPIANFVDIYQLVELQVFEHVVKLVNEGYKIEFSNVLDAKRATFRFCDELIETCGKDVLVETGKVLKRIILRLLTANIEPKFRVLDFIGIEDYWGKFIELIEDVVELFPEEFILENAICLE